MHINNKKVQLPDDLLRAFHVCLGDGSAEGAAAGEQELLAGHCAMNIRIDKQGYNASQYGQRNATVERPPPTRSSHSVRTVCRRLSTRISGKPATLGPLVVVAVFSVVEGWHRAATTHLECQQVAHGAFADVYLGIIQVWQNLMVITGVSDGPLVASVVDLVAVTCALFFALFAGLGAAAAQLWNSAMPG